MRTLLVTLALATVLHVSADRVDSIRVRSYFPRGTKELPAAS